MLSSLTFVTAINAESIATLTAIQLLSWLRRSLSFGIPFSTRQAELNRHGKRLVALDGSCRNRRHRDFAPAGFVEKNDPSLDFYKQLRNRQKRRDRHPHFSAAALDADCCHAEFF